MRVAIVGCGVMGSHHARNLIDFKDVELSAVCDSIPKRAKILASRYHTKYYFDHKELIKKEKIDAVFIAVPTTYHFPIAKDFIGELIPVFIEKPLADTSKAALKIIQTARNKKVFLAVGHIERYNPAVIKLQDLISQKSLGEILAINIKRVGLFPQGTTDINVLLDLGVHDLDIATALVGRMPNSIFARGSEVLAKSKYDHAEIFLDFGRFGCFIQVNWATPIKIRQLSITGTLGHAELNYITQELAIYESAKYRKNPSVGGGFRFKSYPTFVTKFGKPKSRKIKIRRQEPLKVELRNFIDTLKNKTEPKVTNEEALNAIRLAELATRSIKLGKPIKI